MIAAYVDMGAVLYGGMMVARLVEQRINLIFPNEGVLIYMFANSFRPVSLAALATLSLARGIVIIVLRKRHV